MIKFTSATQTGLLVGIGFSDKNLEYLKKGRPVKINLKDLGLTDPIEILVFHGKTEEAMAKMIFDNFDVGHVQRFEDKQRKGD